MEYLIILLANLVYVPTIWYNVISDDSTMMKNAPYNIKRRKFFSVLMHITVAEYIYFAFGTPPAFLAAVLFSIHPIAVQGPVFVSADHYPLMALVFLAVKAFAPFATPLYLLSPGMAVGQLLFTPLCFLFTEYWWISLMLPILAWPTYKSVSGNMRSKIKDTSALATVLPEDFALHKFKWKNIIIVVKTFGYYSLACLLPLKNGFYNSFLATYGLSNKETERWYSLNRQFWGGIFSMVLMASLWWVNRSNHIGMGIMLFVTSLIPFLNFVTVQQFVTPRYCYLALIGFQVALWGLIAMLPLHFQTLIFGALFLFYLDRLLKVLQHYKKDNITMIIMDSQVFPDSPRLWYFRYEHMLHKNNPIMAWAEAATGLKYLPEDCQLWFGLACASYELGDLNAASKFLDTSERFLILRERRDIQRLITEFRQRIKTTLEEKWTKGVA
mgnify:CR=1 FL=1